MKKHVSGLGKQKTDDDSKNQTPAPTSFDLPDDFKEQVEDMKEL